MIYTSWGQPLDQPARTKTCPDLNSIRVMRTNHRHAQARRRRQRRPAT